MGRPMDEPPAPRASQVVQRACTALVLAGVLAVLVSQLTTREWVYDLWADRDLLRSWRLLQEFPTTGAELSFSGGVRIPGGLQHYLMAIPLAFSDDAHHVYLLQAGLQAIGALLLGLAVHRRWGLWPAACALGMWFGSPIPTEIARWLWNPGFVPLFACLTTIAALRYVVDQRARALIGVAAAVACGAQMHLSMLLMLSVLLPALVLARVPGTLRVLPWALGAVLLAYGPYVVHEALTGWENTRAVFSPGQVKSVTPQAGVVGPTKNLRTLVGLVLDAATPERMSWYREVWGAPLAWLLFFAPATLVPAWVAAAVRAVRAGPGPERRMLGLLAGTLGLGTAYFGLRSMVDLSSLLGSRYMLPLWPLACVLFAWGVGALEGALVSRGRSRLAMAVTIALAASLSLRLYVQASDLFSPRWKIRAWGQVVDIVDSLRTETGWTLAEIAGRTVLADSPNKPGEWNWTTYRPIDWLMEREGEAFAGSQPGPCAIVYVWGQPLHPDPAELNAELVRKTLDQPTGVITVQDVRRLGQANWLVLYTIEGERCRTAMIDRYVDTPVEALMRPIWPTLALGAAKELPPPAADTRRVMVVLPGTSKADNQAERERTTIGLDLRTEPGGLAVTMHSNQLRGMTYNGGWLGLAVLRAPRLVLRHTTSGEERVLPITEGLVGYKAQITPLAAGPFPVPPGTWSVRFVADQVELPRSITAASKELEVMPFEAVVLRDLEVR